MLSLSSHTELHFYTTAACKLFARYMFPVYPCRRDWYWFQSFHCCNIYMCQSGSCTVPFNLQQSTCSRTKVCREPLQPVVRSVLAVVQLSSQRHALSVVRRLPVCADENKLTWSFSPLTRWSLTRQAEEPHPAGVTRVDSGVPVPVIRGGCAGKSPVNCIRQLLVEVSQRCACLLLCFNWRWIIYNRVSHVPAQVTTGAARVPSTCSWNLKDRVDTPPLTQNPAGLTPWIIPLLHARHFVFLTQWPRHLPTETLK